MSAGSLVIGLLNGLTIGLLAVGLVLVYKSNRFLNLAHAQMGALSALLLAKWVLDWGWSWWVAFVLAVAGRARSPASSSSGCSWRRCGDGRSRRSGCCCCRSASRSCCWR